MEKHSLAIGSKAYHTVMASFNIKMARNMLDDSSKAQWCVFLRFCPAIFPLCRKFKNWRRDRKKFHILVIVAHYYFFLKIMCSQNKPERVFGLQVRCRELDIFKIRNFLRNGLEFFGFFQDFRGVFLGFFLEFFWRIFLGGFYGRIIFVRNVSFLE